MPSAVVPPDVGIARHDQRARDRRRQQDGPRHDGGRRGHPGEEGHRAPGKAVRGLPDMISTIFSDFSTPSPLSALGTDLYYKIHATSLTTSAFSLPLPPHPFDTDIIFGGPLKSLLKK